MLCRGIGLQFPCLHTVILHYKSQFQSFLRNLLKNEAGLCVALSSRTSLYNGVVPNSGVTNTCLVGNGLGGVTVNWGDNK